jgi:hypothetical protein
MSRVTLSLHELFRDLGTYIQRLRDFPADVVRNNIVAPRLKEYYSIVIANGSNVFAYKVSFFNCTTSSAVSFDIRYVLLIVLIFHLYFLLRNRIDSRQVY